MPTHYTYDFDIDRRVLENEEFKERLQKNPLNKGIDLQNTSVKYIGETGNSPQNRFAQHKEKDGIYASLSYYIESADWLSNFNYDEVEIREKRTLDDSQQIRLDDLQKKKDFTKLKKKKREGRISEKEEKQLRRLIRAGARKIAKKEEQERQALRLKKDYQEQYDKNKEEYSRADKRRKEGYAVYTNAVSPKKFAERKGQEGPDYKRPS